MSIALPESKNTTHELAKEFGHGLLAGLPPLILSLLVRSSLGLMSSGSLEITLAAYVASLVTRTLATRLVLVSRGIADKRQLSAQTKFGIAVAGALTGWLAGGAVSWADHAGLFSNQTTAFFPSQHAEATMCAAAVQSDPYSLTKIVDHPLITLTNQADLRTLYTGGSWFVVNEGTAVHPIFRLGRVYQGGVVRLGEYVHDLSLLGPKMIPEVRLSEIQNLNTEGYSIAGAVPEREMGVFYQMPIQQTSTPLGPEYASRFTKDVANLQGPQVQEASLFGPIHHPVYNVGTTEKGLSPTQIKSVRDTVFDFVDTEKQYPQGTSLADGSACRFKAYADTSMVDPDHPGALVMNRYPLYDEVSLKIQSWVDAHETGHAIAQVTNMPAEFNKLPSDVREHLLEELKKFHEYLWSHGLPATSQDTAPEDFADVLAHYMKNPELVKLQAPGVASFIRKTVNGSIIGTLIHFS